MLSGWIRKLTKEGTVMKKTLTAEAVCHPTVPVQIPLGLLAELRATRDDFFVLCVHAGMQALAGMQEYDRTRVCGEKWSRDPGRQAVRGGSAPAEITLGGRRIAVARLRAANREGKELSLPSFVWAAKRDPLDEHTLEALVAGVSTRKYAALLDPLPEGTSERSVSKSAVSRRFVALSRKKLEECLSRPLGDLDLWVVMVDGIKFRDRTVLLAMGIDRGGTKHVLGIREGTTENATVARELLAELVDRGLPADRPLLFVMDGAKALRKAIRQVFGKQAVVQRCQVHKMRNVVEHLPAHMQASVRRAMRQAYEATTPELARRQLERLAASLEEEHPGAAASLREGLEETLTLQRLGIEGALWRTLRSTNPIENLNGGIAQFTRNVRRWRGGAMVLRWVGAAVLESEKKFRRIRGYRQMPQLVLALSRSGEAEGSLAEKRTA